VQGYASLAQSFDRLAPRYGELIEANPIHAYLRTRSLEWLDEAFRPGMHVLEIGCGTGTEAIHLARRGIEVVATDLSPAMVELTRERVRAAGVENLVRVEQCTAVDAGRRFDQASFDGAYASFGPLNGEPRLHGAVAGLADIVKPNASFITSVVSRPCAVELMLALTCRFNKAFRRLREETRMDLSGLGPVDVRAYSETEIRKAFFPRFRIERLEGWLVVMPPPYLASSWMRLGPTREAVMLLDNRVRKTWPFRGWGDHLHVWARRA